MEKKNIAVFINSIEAGGGERVATLLLYQLENDYNIHLVLLNDTIEYPLPEHQLIYCFKQPYRENSIIKILKIPYLAYRYKRYCKKNNIEKSLSFLGRANYINCFSKILRSGATVIISERTYLSGYLKSIGKVESYFVRFLAKLLYPYADIIIPNSQLTKIDLQSNFNIKGRYKVINNPIDITSVTRLSSINTDKEQTGSHFTFIHAGRLKSEKNHTLLIEAFNKIRDLDCKLLLLGKGNEEEHIKTLIGKLGLESKVILLGFDSNPYKYFSKSDCFVLSSNFEGFPNAILEALACKLPVISTDCRSGPREILAPGTDIEYNVADNIEIAPYGILVPVNNIETMATAMRLIYSDALLRNNLKTKGYERALLYDTSNIIDQFRQVLSE